MLIDREAMCRQQRSDYEYSYSSEPGKSCPDEILDTLEKYNVQGRPIWKAMHMQPIYRSYDLITRDGTVSDSANGLVVSEDIFERGLCLPSDINMTAEEQEKIIQIIVSCFE
jgi:dTDP-4-amino-4,6-dideoxygalactose transaminase